MTRLQFKIEESQRFDDNSALIRRIQREISCLERQLERLLTFEGNIDKRTQDTYSEMIFTREEMLSNLGC